MKIDKPGEIVPRGLPEFLAGSKRPQITAEQSGRLQLANWIASQRNPLTARVIVNRVWSWMFGQGIVKSVDNFGTTGDPKQSSFARFSGEAFYGPQWSIKQLVREIAAIACLLTIK